MNNSISRRHAVLHFDADKRRFVITDLGGGNGVIVNKVKQQSHELNDGDLVELGEVRLRFRANAEAIELGRALLASAPHGACRICCDPNGLIGSKL